MGKKTPLDFQSSPLARHSMKFQHFGASSKVAPFSSSAASEHEQGKATAAGQESTSTQQEKVMEDKGTVRV